MANTPTRTANGGNGKAPATRFVELLKKNETRLRNLLPDYISPERYLSLAMLAVHKDPAVMAAAKEAPETVVESVLRAAQLGLEIGGAVPGAHLVAFRNNRKGGRYECQMIPDYRGLIQLAVDSGAIVSGDARVVYEGERFEVHYGTEAKIVHVPDFDAIDRGVIKAFYFVAKLANGETKFEVMTKKQVDAVKARSKAGDSGPWATDYAEMGKKTVTKRGLKYIPMSPNNAAARRLAMAIEADNRFETGGPTTVVPDWDDEETLSAAAAAQTIDRTEELKARMQQARARAAQAKPTGRDVTPPGPPEPGPEPEPANAAPEPPAQPAKDRRQESLQALYRKAVAEHAPELRDDADARRMWEHWAIGKTRDQWAEDDYRAAIAKLERREGLGVPAGVLAEEADQDELPFD
ncbi:MAG TPA: recombinase RecT [Vicinamibacterales bacterium]